MSDPRYTHKISCGGPGSGRYPKGSGNNEPTEGEQESIDAWTDGTGIQATRVRDSQTLTREEMLKREMRDGTPKEFAERKIEDATEKADNIEKYISRADKHEGDLYRGIGVSSEEEFFNNVKEGSSLDMQGTSSWTSDEGVAEKYSKKGDHSVVFKVKSKSGVSIEKYVKNKESKKNKEFLYSSKSKFKVTNIKRGRTGSIVELEEYNG